MNSDNGFGTAPAPVIAWPSCARVACLGTPPIPANDEVIRTPFEAKGSERLRLLVDEIRRGQSTLASLCDGTCGFNIAFGYTSRNCGYVACPVKIAFEALERLVETRHEIPM